MSTTDRKPRSPIREALSHRDFRNLAIANAVSQTGDWLYNVALFVYIFNVTGSPGWVAVASFFRLLPSVVISPFAGVIADRFERRAVMMWSAGLGALLMGLLALVAATTESAFTAVALAFACNAALTPYRPAVTAITPAVLPERSLAAGNTILGSIVYLATALGPAVGGILLLFGPPAVAFAVNSASFLIAVVVLTRVRTRSKEQSDAIEPPRVLDQFREGVRTTFRNADARVLAFFMAAAYFLYGQELVTFVVYSEERLGVGPDGMTYLMAGIGVGGIIGAAFTSRVGNTARPGRFLWLSSLLSGTALIGLALISVPWLAYVTISLDGIGAILAEVVCITLLQRAISQKLLGRVFGAVESLAIMGVLLGSLVTPWLISTLGTQVTLVVAGATLPLLTLAISGSIRRLDQRSAERKAQLDDLVDLLAQSQLMEGAPRQALELVAGSLEPLTVPAGTDVVVQGDRAENLYIIREGSVDVMKSDAGGSVRLATLGSGDFFGEIGVLEGKPRMATVTTTTGTGLLKIGGEDFMAALEMSSGVARRVSGTVVSRLAEAESKGNDEAA